MRIRTLALVGTTAMLLTACGSEGNGMAELSGPEVAHRAATALEEAGSATVSGTYALEGQPGEIDLHVQGEDAVGTVTMDGTDVQLLATGGQFFLQAPAAFWTGFGMPAEFAGQFDGRWVAVPAEASAGFGELSLTGLADEIRDPGDARIQDEVGTDERDGAPVVVVEDDAGGTLTVAGEGTEYPLEVETTGEDGGTMTFSRFGEEEIIAPADALDLMQLGA